MQPSPGPMSGRARSQGSLLPDDIEAFEKAFARIDEEAKLEARAVQEEHEAAIQALDQELKAKQDKHEAALHEDLIRSRASYNELLQELRSGRLAVLEAQLEKEKAALELRIRDRKGDLYQNHPFPFPSRIRPKTPGLPQPQASLAEVNDTVSPATTAATAPELSAASSPTVLNAEEARLRQLSVTSTARSTTAPATPIIQHSRRLFTPEQQQKPTEKRKAIDSAGPETTKRSRDGSSNGQEHLIVDPAQGIASTSLLSGKPDANQTVVVSQSPSPDPGTQPRIRTPQNASRGVDNKAQNGKKTMSFAQVHCEGKPEYYHTIIQFPPGIGKWYILKCDEHMVHFSDNPLPGAAKHLHGSKHNLGKQHSTAVATLGVLIPDCTAELAEQHNALVRTHFANGNKPLNLNLLSAREKLLLRFGRATPISAKKQKQKASSSTTPEQSPISAKSATGFKGVWDPDPSQLYQGFWDREWYPIMVLPWKELRCRKTAEDGDTVKKIWLQPELLLRTPAKCFRVDKAKQRIVGWNADHGDGEPLMHERLFPVVFKDSNNSVAWLQAEHIAILDTEKRNMLQLQDWVAQCLGYDSYEQKIMADSQVQESQHSTRVSLERLETENEERTKDNAQPGGGKPEATESARDVDMAEEGDSGSDAMDIDTDPGITTIHDPAASAPDGDSSRVEKTILPAPRVSARTNLPDGPQPSKPTASEKDSSMADLTDALPENTRPLRTAPEAVSQHSAIAAARSLSPNRQRQIAPELPPRPSSASARSFGDGNSVAQARLASTPGNTAGLSVARGVHSLSPKPPRPLAELPRRASLELQQREKILSGGLSAESALPTLPAGPGAAGNRGEGGQPSSGADQDQLNAKAPLSRQAETPLVPINVSESIQQSTSKISRVEKSPDRSVDGGGQEKAPDTAAVSATADVAPPAVRDGDAKVTSATEKGPRTRPTESAAGSEASLSPAPSMIKRDSSAQPGPERGQTYDISQYRRESPGNGGDELGEQFGANDGSIADYLKLVVSPERPSVAESAAKSTVRVAINPLTLAGVAVAYEASGEALVTLTTPSATGDVLEHLRFPNQPGVGKPGRIQARKFCGWLSKTNPRLNIKKL